MEKARYTGYLDLVRIIACILVVGVHVSAMNLYDLPVTGINFQIMNAFDCISILGVPLFAMVSGSLMLSEEHDSLLKKLYLGKVCKTVILYFLFLIFYNIVRVVENGMVWNIENIKQEIILESLFGRGIYHLWFLPMIAMLYVITPFIKGFVQDKKLCMLYLSIYFVIEILLPTTFQFEYPYKSILYHLDLQYPHLIFTGYLGYYVLGFFLHKHTRNLKKWEMVFVAAFGMLIMLAEILICNWDSVRREEPSAIVNNPLLAFTFLSSACVFLLIRQLQFKREKTLTILSSLTLGIYLIHPFVINMCQKLGMNTLFAPSIISVPLMILWITLISAILSMIASQIIKVFCKIKLR